MILQQGGSVGPSLCVVGPGGYVGRGRITRFLDPQAGRRIFVRLRLMSNGFTTPPQTFSRIVVKHGG